MRKGKGERKRIQKGARRPISIPALAVLSGLQSFKTVLYTLYISGWIFTTLHDLGEIVKVKYHSLPEIEDKSKNNSHDDSGNCKKCPNSLSLYVAQCLVPWCMFKTIFFKRTFGIIFLPSYGLVFAIADFLNGAQFVEAFSGCSVVIPSMDSSRICGWSRCGADMCLWRILHEYKIAL